MELLAPEEMQRRVDATCQKFDARLDLYDRKYREAEQRRRCCGLPAVAFIGHGRAGKDAASAMLSGLARLLPPVSQSEIINEFVADSLGLQPDDNFEQRHDNWQFWKDWCNAFRRNDQTRLLRMSFGQADIIAGIRSWHELRAGLRTGVIDHAVWVNRMDSKPDPTMEYDAGNAVALMRRFPIHWIDNNRGLGYLAGEVAMLARNLGLLV